MIEIIECAFTDRATYDGVAKRAISVRDGILEYNAAELGVEGEGTKTVYRSPATIAAAAQLMTGIPVTDEHVDLSVKPSDPVGSIESATPIDLFDESTDSKLGIENVINLDDARAVQIADNKKELSLGYVAQLVPHDKYDYEQRDIRPHHLAIVPLGRCGSSCSFIDKKTVNQPEGVKEMAEKLFLDDDGAVSMERVAQAVSELPDAIKTVDMSMIADIIPALEALIEAARGVLPEEMEDEEAEETTDEEAETMDCEATDGKDFSDSAEFKDAVNAAADQKVKLHAGVMQKAKDFLDAGYDYSEKSADDIMRDALATEHDQEFEDSELSVAFKMLKKAPSDLTNFGDSKEPSLTDLADKEY